MLVGLYFQHVLQIIHTLHKISKSESGLRLEFAQSCGHYCGDLFDQLITYCP